MASNVELIEEWGQKIALNAIFRALKLVRCSLKVKLYEQNRPMK